MGSFLNGGTYMKALFFSVIAACVLSACGGGGGSSGSTVVDNTQKADATCTKPTTQGSDLTLSGNSATVNYSAMPKLVNVTIGGNVGTINFKECSFVKKLTITGSANTVQFDATSDVEEVVFAVNSGTNSVILKKTSTATVQDLGNQNDLVRTN